MLSSYPGGVGDAVVGKEVAAEHQLRMPLEVVDLENQRPREGHLMRRQPLQEVPFCSGQRVSGWVVGVEGEAHKIRVLL